MEFILFEHRDGTTSIALITDSITIPQDAIAFTHYLQSSQNKDGKIKHIQYRIGKPVKFIIGEMYNEIAPEEINDDNYNNLFYLYIQNNKKCFASLDKNIALVNSYTELEESFYKHLKSKGPTRKR